MDKNDLAALLIDAPAAEVDQIHRLLHEWSIGPDSSFPVQLTLLTKAQWRVAANLPNLMNDAGKLIEQHLAEYRRQTKSMTEDFSARSGHSLKNSSPPLKNTAKPSSRRLCT